MSFQVYLASRSPRRQQLLQQIGVSFELRPVDVPEQPVAGQSAADYAVSIALAKARAGARGAPLPRPVLGADTDVVVDGRILGKPENEEQAVDMLDRLSDRTHQVFSGVAVVDGPRHETALSVTRVTFGTISARTARRYWESGEPVGKAGAYAIQGRGARFVKSIEGSYSGVMGLPLFETCELLRRFDVDLG